MQTHFTIQKQVLLTIIIILTLLTELILILRCDIVPLRAKRFYTKQVIHYHIICT